VQLKEELEDLHTTEHILLKKTDILQDKQMNLLFLMKQLLDIEEMKFIKT
jgi:hypothetical protein